MQIALCKEPSEHELDEVSASLAPFTNLKGLRLTFEAIEADAGQLLIRLIPSFRTLTSFEMSEGSIELSHVSAILTVAERLKSLYLGGTVHIAPNQVVHEHLRHAKLESLALSIVAEDQQTSWNLDERCFPELRHLVVGFDEEPDIGDGDEGEAAAKKPKSLFLQISNLLQLNRLDLTELAALELANLPALPVRPDPTSLVLF